MITVCEPEKHHPSPLNMSPPVTPRKKKDKAPQSPAPEPTGERKEGVGPFVKFTLLFTAEQHRRLLDVAHANGVDRATMVRRLVVDHVGDYVKAGSFGEGRPGEVTVRLNDAQLAGLRRAQELWGLDAAGIMGLLLTRSLAGLIAEGEKLRGDLIQKTGETRE